MTHPLRWRLGIVAAATLAVLTGFAAGPAFAEPVRPPTINCNPNQESTWVGIGSARVEWSIYQFIAVHITPGTTGTQTHTRTVTQTVSTTVNESEEITAEASVLFLKVSAKIGFSVQSTKSSTRTDAATATYNFQSPGTYGLFRGTRKVSGEWSKWVCARTGPSTGIWVNALPGGQGTYTTFEHTAEGTVSCHEPKPNGTMEYEARLLLRCPAGRVAA